TLTARRIATGLSRPVFATAPPGDLRRLLVLEQGNRQHPGRIKVLDLASGRVNAAPFLEVPEISADFNEQGLLGMTFHSRYTDNGFFYVNFTEHPGHDAHRLITHIRRYTVSS